MPRALQPPLNLLTPLNPFPAAPPPPPGKYKIKGSPILGRHSAVLLAKNIYNRQRVAIKFFTDAGQFAREKSALRLLSSGFVPALEEPIDGWVAGWAGGRVGLGVRAGGRVGGWMGDPGAGYHGGWVCGSKAGHHLVAG